MGFFLIILFVIVPILEISLFISVGEAIGLWPTLTTVITTAIIGATLLKKQGLDTWVSAQRNFSRGQFPLEDIYKGVCLIIASALLITPGFFTDLIGFLCFFPSFRLLLRTIFSNMLVARTATHVYTTQDYKEQKGASTKTIDGDFEEIKNQNNDPNHLNSTRTKGKN